MVNIFTEHPSEEPSQTYWEHGLFAVKYSTKGLIASLSGYIHAVFPFLFPYTSSTLFIEIYTAIEESGRHSEEVAQKWAEKMQENATDEYYLVPKSKTTGRYLKELAT